MYSVPTTSLSAVAVIALFGCAGCGSGGPSTHPVTGVVTLDNEPIEGAVVTFNPSGSEGRSATGTTDASGRYELTTLASGDGATEGSYRVTIAKYEYPDGTAAEPATEEEPPEMTPEEEAAYMEEAYEEEEDVDPPAENVLPQKYSNPATSGFEAEVTSGENSFDFDLSTGG